MAALQQTRSSRRPSYCAAPVPLAVLLRSLLQQSTQAMPCGPSLLLIMCKDLADTQSTTPGAVAAVRKQLARAAHPWNPAAEGLQRFPRLVSHLAAVSGPALPGELWLRVHLRQTLSARYWWD